MKKYIPILIALIFLWGIALRAVEVVNGNYLFGFDVGRDMLVARNIVENHKYTLIGAEVGSGSAGINGIFQGPGYYYLLTIPYILFRGDPYGVLLTMFLFGVVTLALSYWTCRRMFGKGAAIVSLFLVAVSPLIVSQSRFIWAPHPASLLIVLSLYFTYMIYKRPRLYAPLAMLTAGLTYHFEFAMTIPMMIAILIAMPLIYRIKDIKTYVYSIAATVFVFLPMIAFEMRHGFMAVKSIFSYAAPQGVQKGEHLIPYIYNASNSFPTEHGMVPGQWFIPLCGALLVALMVIAWKEKDKARRKFFQFFLLSLVVSYVVFLFLNNVIWDYYLIHAHFIYMYVFAYLFTRKSKIISIILFPFLLSMIVSSAWRMMISYRDDIHDLGGVEKIQGKKIAIDYVYQDAKEKAFSEFTFMAPIYTYPYEYLFATYGKKKYGYVPGNQKKGLVYLIIEPDRSKPWTYKGWLETVIVGGEILDTKTLETGHIIQKRLFP